jgi:uncharacterized protein (TIGR03435 family)
VYDRTAVRRSDLFVVVAVATLLAGLVTLPRIAAQSSTADWERAAGGKMAFEVASVKRQEPGTGPGAYRSNFPLTLGSNFKSVGNLMSVDIPVRALIGFAFKLSVGQTHFLISNLPDWVDSEWFDVEARAPIAAPSKDQFRLMAQALLADRFKLKMHTDTRTIPIYSLVLVNPGKTGPQLRPHIDDSKCAEPRTAAPTSPTDFSPFPCGSTVMGGMSDSDRIRGGGRGVSLDYIAALLTGVGFQGIDSDRPVVNQTGLTGTYDFWIDFLPVLDPAEIARGADTSGPSFPEALRDQLGLKLVAKTAPVGVLIVDHIEEPAPN